MGGIKVKITFLGTGAADWPNIKSNEVEKDGRRYCSLIINQNILIDVAPQSFDYAMECGIDISSITDVFISHSHMDHYNKETMMNFAQKATNKIRLWCHEDAVKNLNLSEQELENFILKPLEVGKMEETKMFRVMPLEANHDVKNEIALHYLFDFGEKRVFYGCDGGGFTANTWQYLLDEKVNCDCAILDTTVGDYDWDCRIGSHNCIPMLRIIVASAKANEVFKKDALLIANHLAKYLHKTHKETEKICAEFGMKTAFDGYTVEF